MNFYYYSTKLPKKQSLHSLAGYVTLAIGDSMKKQAKGSILLLLATVIWGSAFVAQSAGMDMIGPFTFQTVRCFLAVLALLPAIAVFDRKDFLKKWRDPQLWKAGLVCGCALFVAAGLQQYALQDTDAGKAGFITAMYIVFVPILGLFFRKKPTFWAIISIVIAIVGLYLLSCVGVESVNVSDILLLGCAVAFAVQITFVDRYAAQVDPLRLNCIQALVVTALSAIPMLLFEKPAFSAITDSWLPLFYAGVMSMGVAYSLQIIGQKVLEPTTASLIMSLESVFAALSGWLILNQTLSPWELAGCCLVFVAVILSQLPSKKSAVQK